MNTAPQPKRRGRQYDDEGPKPISRREERGDDDIEMPPITAPHLFERLMEIGPVDLAGMDRAPLRPGTIAAWSADLGITLPPWEVRLLRRLSAEYLAQSRDAVEVDAPPPWSAPDADLRNRLDRKLALLFGDE